MDISCFDLKGELKEDDKMKKYADMVKNLKVQYINHTSVKCKTKKKITIRAIFGPEWWLKMKWDFSMNF